MSTRLRTLPLFLPLATILTLIAAAPVYAQDKVYDWERFDTEIVVNKDGAFDNGTPCPLHPLRVTVS